MGSDIFGRGPRKLLGLAFAAVFSAAGGGAFAGEGNLSVNAVDAIQFAPYCYQAGTNGYEAVTLNVMAELPDDLKEHVLFQLDASDRAGWSYADEAETLVTNLPSACGTRFANVSPLDGNVSRTAYGAPVLVTNDVAFGCRPYLDFGAHKSGRGLFFNPYKALGATVASNRIEGVGAIVSVYGSQEGGGELVGGPFRTTDGAEKRDGYAHRGYQTHTAEVSSFIPILYANKLFDASGRAYAALRDAVVRQNAQEAPAQGVGLSGEWEILTVIPTKAIVDASGIGINSLGSGDGNCGGGMRIAETIYFDRALSSEEIEAVEAYLSKKWNLHCYRGYRGNAHLGYLHVMQNTRNIEGVSVSAATEGDETMTIDCLRGGRGRDSSLVKSGTGTLRVGDASRFGGVIVMRGGTLDLTRRAIPTEDELPTNCQLRVDASSANAFAKAGALSSEGGTEYVNFWANEASATWYGKPLTGLACNTDQPARRPWILRDALGAGKHAIDFGNGWHGADGNTQAPQCYLRITTNQTVGAEVKKTSISHVTTVIAAMGAQRGGGTLLSGDGATWGVNAPFAKGGGNLNDNGRWHTAILAASKFTANSVQYTVTPSVYLDGRKVDRTHNFEAPCYHTLAIQTQGSDCHTVSAFCGSGYFANPQRPGALRLCEMFVYDHVLTEREMLDVEAYLAWKWYGKVNPGYQRPAAAKWVDLPRLRVESAATVHVPAGTTYRIGKVTLEATLAKTGDGVLEIGELVASDGCGITGSNVRGLSDVPDVSAKCEVAAGASFHIDPSRPSTLLAGTTENGTNWIFRATSTDGQNVAGIENLSYGKGYYNPWTSPAETCNGLSVLDFGPEWGGYKPYFGIGYPMDNVRSVFVVYGSQRGGSTLFGSYVNDYASVKYDNRNCWDFFRDRGTAKDTGSNRGFCANNGNDVYACGGFVSLYTNGVKTACNTPPLGCYQLVEFHCPMGMCIAALGRHGDSIWGGSGLYGEMIVYERDLSEREKVATRNYLLKKWFAKSEDELPDLPEAEALPGDALADNTTVEGTVDAVTDLDRTVKILSGSGTLAKGGAGTLSLVETKDFTGTLSVTGGVVRMIGEPQETEPTLVTDGLLVRLDASEGLDVTENGTYREVAAWHNLATGLYSDLRAEGVNVAGSYATGAPFVDAKALAGRDVVNATANGQGLYFKDSSGKMAIVSDVRCVFWVMDTTCGGGFPLMGATNDVYTSDNAVGFGGCLAPVARDGQGTKPTDAICRNGNSRNACCWADWRENGKLLGKDAQGWPIVWTNGFLGAWEVVSMNFRADYAERTDPEGYILVAGLAAYGGSVYGNFGNPQQKSLYAGHAGHVRLAEVLMYNRRLTDAEVLSNNTYLNRKWGLNNTIESTENDFALAVGAGGTLDLDGRDHRVRSLSGAGTVRNGTIETSTLAFNFDTDGTLTVDGTFVFGEGFKVSLSGTPVPLPERGLKIVSTTSFEGQANFSSKAIEGDGASHYILVLRSDGLYLREFTGMTLFIW